MSIRKWLFAAWYELLNAGVEVRVIPYRKETAGRTWGDVLEIGGGTGANIPYFPADTRLTFILPITLRTASATRDDICSVRPMRVPSMSIRNAPYPAGIMTTLEGSGEGPGAP